MARGSEQKPKLDISMPAPPVHKLIPLTDEQVQALVSAQGLVNEAQQMANDIIARRDALLLGIMAGAHISAGRALRITDEKPARLEVELMANGNGKAG